jgi:AAA domain
MSQEPNLLEANTPLPQELIHGVLHKTLKAELAGGSKTMKSWALIDLALSFSLGVSWWGFQTTKARVLFLNLEIPRPFFRERLGEVVSARKLKLDPNTLLVQHLRGFDLSRREVWERLMRDIVRRGPWDLLVLDPIYKTLGSRDENNASDVTEILISLERAAELTGAAVLFSHHYAKGSAALKESTDRMSGSGVWMRDPDSYLAMTRHEEEDCFTIEPTLRNLAPVKPFVMRWTHPVFKRAPDLDPEELRQQRKPGPATKFDVNQIVSALNGDTLSTPQLKKRVVEETGMSRSKFYELLIQAEKRKLLVKDGQTNTRERPELNYGRR